MEKLTTLFLLIFATTFSFSQELTGTQLLNKAIQFHDPQGKWKTFEGTLFLSTEISDRPNRESEVKINLPKEYFSMKMKQEDKVTESIIEKGKCSFQLNGKTPTEEEAKANELSCDRANLFKNYFSYLYGLPMKLKDPGTLIDPKVNRKKFKGKEYLLLSILNILSL